MSSVKTKGRAFKPKVVTANDLMEGDAIYLTSSLTWTRVHAEAELATEPERADALLEIAQAQRSKVVGPYLADAVATDDGPAPVHFREAFRTRGPSNRNHGKQEANGQEARSQEASHV